MFLSFTSSFIKSDGIALTTTMICLRRQPHAYAYYVWATSEKIVDNRYVGTYVSSQAYIVMLFYHNDNRILK